MGHTEQPSVDGAAVRRDWRGGLEVRLLRNGEEARWRELMAAQHYLREVPPIGECLRYVATVDGRWVALLSWGPAAWRCGPRERWLGWAPAMRRRRLHLVANNTRFLILRGILISNLASAVLAANTRRLAADWRRVHGHPLWLAETFVDPSRFRGTAYRAAGWLSLGLTRGFGRSGGHYVHHGQPKVLWVRPLVPDARTRLADPWSDPQQEGGGLVPKPNFEGWNWTGPDGLRERLVQLGDPRHARGIRHNWGSIILMACAAVLAGQKNFVEVSEWVGDLPADLLARFGARYIRGQYQAPSEPTFRRALQRVDADRIDAILSQWCAAEMVAEAIAIDGKTLRGSGHGQPPAHLLAALLHREGVVIAQQAVPSKTNEIPGLRSLLEPVDIADRVVTADALHAQVETARYLVEDKEAHYVLQLKANQPTLLAEVETLGPEDFSPSAHHAGEGARTRRAP